MKRRDDGVILITGGAGSIGGNLTRHLNPTGKRIVVIDNLSSGFKKNVPASRNIVFIKGDVTKDADLKKAFSYDVSVVFHLAAHFANQNSIDHPREDLMTNALGTLKTLEYAVKKKVGKFVYASTSCIYGDAKTVLKEEMLDYKHDTPYSVSKLTGEKYVMLFHDYYRLKACILRYFNVYGPGEYPGAYRNVIPNFFHKAMRGEPLTITGTGDETRDFTYVGDVVATTVKAAGNDRSDGQVFNVASGEETRVIDLAEKINNIAGNRAGIVYVKRRSWDRVLRRRADTAKARQILGHKITVRIDEGLKRTYEWLKRA